MITVGPMALNQPQAADPMEPFFRATQSGGGYWTDISRLSSHDHSGGLMGAAVAVSIPDGSITAADLDPSVLAPYALVDGSKPFTGQVTMQADAVVRDALYFGQQGTALAPDVTLSRTGAGALRVDTHLGVGVNPLSWLSALNSLHVGQASVLRAHVASAITRLQNNAYTDGAGANRAIVAGAASALSLDAGGTIMMETAPAVAAGAVQTFTTRAQIGTTGTLTLSPDAGAAVLSTPGLFSVSALPGYPSSARITSGQYLILEAGSNIVQPYVDNSYSLGSGTARWTVVYAAAGTINTSSQEFKEAITPLSPAECYQAAKDVRWYSYAYRPPAYTPPEPPPDIAYDASDDNATKAEKKAARDEAEAASKAAHLKMVAETAPARHQRGFVFGGAEAKDERGEPLPPVPELFGLSDRQSTTPQADLATLGCALQEVIRRLEQLEAPAA